MVWYAQAAEVEKENGGDFVMSTQKLSEILMTRYF